MFRHFQRATHTAATRGRRAFSSASAESAQSFFARHRSKVPVAGAVIGTCGLFFNTNILGPWHLELRDQFTEIDNEVERTAQRNREHAEILRRIVGHEEAIKDNERKILQREGEVLAMQRDILDKLELIEKDLMHEK